MAGWLDMAGEPTEGHEGRAACERKFPPRPPELCKKTSPRHQKPCREERGVLEGKEGDALNPKN